MPARGIVYANCNGNVGYAGGWFTLRADEPWDAADPLVKDRPDLFSAQPTEVRRTVPAVETATAAPGEKRRRG